MKTPPRWPAFPAGLSTLFPVAILLCWLPTAVGLGAELPELLAGKVHPLSMKLGELGPDWRRFTVAKASTASGNISVSVNGGNGSSGSSQNNIADLGGSPHYITQGKTVTLHGETYLVAYHVRGGGLELPALIQALVTKSAPEVAVLSAETPLPLSLLHLKSVGSLEDIRAFDAQQEIAESAKTAKLLAAALASGADAGSSGGKATNAPPTGQKSGK